jgi:hypothetical protein
MISRTELLQSCQMANSAGIYEKAVREMMSCKTLAQAKKVGVEARARVLKNDLKLFSQIFINLVRPRLSSVSCIALMLIFITLFLLPLEKTSRKKVLQLLFITIFAFLSLNNR